MKKAEAIASFLTCITDSKGVLLKSEISKKTLVLRCDDFLIAYALQWVWTGSYGRFGGYLGFVQGSNEESSLSVERLFNDISTRTYWLETSNIKGMLEFAAVTDAKSVKSFSRFMLDKMESLFPRVDLIKPILNDGRPTPKSQLEIVQIVNES